MTIRSKVNNKAYRENYERIFQHGTQVLKYKSKVEIFDPSHGFIIHSWHRNIDNALINAEVICKSRNIETRVVRLGKIEQTFKPEGI